ncbi:MAG: hypothetical protein KHX03_09215 [Clostridium sp.]|nr:hypothetical protein [Clostridium sp.]
MTFHTIEKIKNLIEFNDEAVNTKILAKSDNNLALLGALKKDQLMPEHISPVDAFIFIIEGEIEFTIYENPNTEEQTPRISKLLIKD